MHKLAEKIADCMKAKVEGMGIDNIEGQDLVELGMWTDIIKDLVCYDKDKKIIEAMDEAEESEEAMKYIEMYEDYPEMRRGYRGQPRDSRGRYMSRRRMGYEEPMRMMPEMNREHDAEYYRDMDKMDGRMYYSSGNMGGQSSSGMSGGSMGSQGRDSREGRSGQMRRYYMESKETGKDKGEKMKELENYMKELSTDVTEMISDASPEEKTMLKQKMQMLMQKI
jgi:hypothetical protein